jgi:hypothetical protein
MLIGKYMTSCEKEYESLRQELSEDRKYIFERPLLITTVALLCLDGISKSQFSMLFPNFIIFLLLFNLNFTSNRLKSSARIIYYIKCVIEKNNPSNYRWETFLSEYRATTENKGLKYYPTIYWFHILTMIFFVLIELVLYIKNPINLFNLCHQIDWNSLWVRQGELNFYYPEKDIITILSLFLCTIGIFFIFKIGSETSHKNITDFFDKEADNVNHTLENLESKSTPIRRIFGRSFFRGYKSHDLYSKL